MYSDVTIKRKRKSDDERLEGPPTGILVMTTDQRAKRPQREMTDNTSSDIIIFKDTIICIFPFALGKSRLNLFRTLVVRYGGRLMPIEMSAAHDADDPALKCPQVIVADDSLNIERIQKILPSPWKSADLVKISWISECIRQKRLMDVDEFLFRLPELESTNESKRNLKLTSGDHAGSSSLTHAHNCKTTTEPQSNFRPNINPARFICSRPSTSQAVNYNHHITEKLEALAATYKTSKDYWRAVGYERAITTLKRYPKEITTWEEAKSLPGIGDRLADKIHEIIESGRLRKMDEVTSDDRVIAMQLFASVWGIGPITAELLVQRGYRTLDDLEAANCLNNQQLIGLRHHADLLDRMPRDEAAEIERTVVEASQAIQPNVVCMACGSYRRGKANCGDVDVLVTHPDGRSHTGLLSRLVLSLRKTGFLTDDLVAHEENGAQHKYMGVCRLPRNDFAKHRRLDIIVVPFSEYACSLLYFTGSAHFNRSVRLLARKMSMSLSEHALKTGVIRQGQDRLCEGYPLQTPTEQSIFEHLGLPYRPPEERDH